MVAFGRLAFTGRFFLAVVTIYLLYVAITLLLPGEESVQTLKHVKEEIGEKSGENCVGENCQSVKTGEEGEEAEKAENARLKEENAKLLEENTKLKEEEEKEEPAAKLKVEKEEAKPWISANTDVRLWIGWFCFSFKFETYRVPSN